MSVCDDKVIHEIYCQIKSDWHCLPNEILNRLRHCELPLSHWLYQRCIGNESAFVMGINGPQGSGKSTTGEALQTILQHYYGLRVLVVSIDDFYLTKNEREELGCSVHPLLATRGVPGTHDVRLAQNVLQALKFGNQSSYVSVPRFNKAVDDRFGTESWSKVQVPVDVILFDGWCVGAESESVESLLVPLNWLEEQEDINGDWRGYVNHALGSEYQALFKLLDALLVFQYGDFSWVYDWRKQQEIENENRAKVNGLSTDGIMDDAALKRFILHYERITRACQRSLPEKADVCISINKKREVTSVQWKAR